MFFLILVEQQKDILLKIIEILKILKYSKNT